VPDLPPIYTKHARQRMDEMGVSPSTVYHALNDPDMDYQAPRRHGPTARLACKGDVAVAYKPDDRQPDRKVIMTVLWNRKVFKRPEHEDG
jgi:hypothetical protein